jgi:hypothetical protein
VEVGFRIFGTVSEGSSRLEHMFEDVAMLPADPLRDDWWDAARLSPPADVEDLAGWAGDRQLLTGDPGGVLAAAVEDCTTGGRIADLDDDAVVEVAVAAQRLIGWAMGAQLQAVAELGRRWAATPLGERAAVAELALACGVSEYASSRRMDAAMLLPWRLPRVWAELGSGRLEWAKAWEILDRTLVLSDAHTAEVEQPALEVALTGNLPDLRAHLVRAVAQVDPEGAAERAREAHARRGVSFRPGPDHTGVMALTASAATVAAAEAALNRLTAAALGGGDSGEDVAGQRRPCPEVTRADVLIDLIHTADGEWRGEGDDNPQTCGDTSRGPGKLSSARGQVVVTVPLSVVLGLSEQPGRMAGYGPIPAPMARELIGQLAHSGTWRCAVTDDRPGRVHGTLLALGRSAGSLGYSPSQATRDFVTTRDGTCRFTGCRQPAVRAALDLDHRVPWRRDGAGGATCDCNLQSLCGNHHRLKHEARFTVEPDDDGTLTWTTPTGRTHRKPPTALPHGPVPAIQVPSDPDPPPF